MANERISIFFKQQSRSLNFLQQRAPASFGLARIVGGINWSQTRTPAMFGIPRPTSFIPLSSSTDFLASNNRILI
jgi:hypothetical protein